MQTWERVSGALAAGGFKRKVTQCRDHWQKLKQIFKALKELVKASGLGWDDENQVVTGERSVLEAYCKAHPDARRFLAGPWPHYEHMDRLCNGIIATGDDVFVVGPTTTSSIGILTHAPAPTLSTPSTAACETSLPANNPATFTSISASTVTSTSNKRKRQANNNAVHMLAESVNALLTPRSTQTPTLDASPIRRDRAFRRIVRLEQLSPCSTARARRIFRGRTDLADEYLSFADDEAEERQFWLNFELTALEATEHA
jgi:hypothetical protein